MGPGGEYLQQPDAGTDGYVSTSYASTDVDEKSQDGGYSEEDIELAELVLDAEEDDNLLKASDEKDTDLEAQTTTNNETAQTPVEYSVSTRRKLIFLGLYFTLNLGLTLSNKALLQKVSYPWLLTFSHTTCTSIGCLILLATGQVKLSQLSLRDNLVLAAFSVLFTLNIAISNVSLSLVSIPFHQIMRATCPVVTVLLYRVVYGRTYSTETYLSLIPLIAGVAIATFGDYYFTILGFLLTVLGVLLASIKTVATNRLMTGSLKLSAIEALFRMSPLAAIQCLVGAALTGEISRLWQITTAEDSQFSTSILLLILGVVGNGTMAFALNLVSFQTNKVAGALTMTVSANVKQIITILLGILLFNLKVAPLNGVGMAIAIAGAACYSKFELDRKKATTSI